MCRPAVWLAQVVDVQGAVGLLILGTISVALSAEVLRGSAGARRKQKPHRCRPAADLGRLTDNRDLARGQAARDRQCAAGADRRLAVAMTMKVRPLTKSVSRWRHAQPRVIRCPPIAVPDDARSTSSAPVATESMVNLSTDGGVIVVAAAGAAGQDATERRPCAVRWRRHAGGAGVRIDLGPAASRRLGSGSLRAAVPSSYRHAYGMPRVLHRVQFLLAVDHLARPRAGLIGCAFADPPEVMAGVFAARRSSVQVHGDDGLDELIHHHHEHDLALRRAAWIS